MDGPNADHSDSDSGESWTLLEETPAYADEALEYCDGLPKQKGDTADSIEKDEDTDGISVITDSEPESMPCEAAHETSTMAQGNRPTDQIPPYISVNPYPDNSNEEHIESMRSANNLLGESSVKLKTYVHRRNRRLSTVLNIIVLGSVITAAGVAIGHMWGVRDDCSMHTTPSVNKILSNLYKLQEENAYLRNKLQELTLLNNIQMQRKSPTGKSTIKQPRCKKMFEEPLNNKNANRVTKCLDDDVNNTETIENHVVQPEYEKRFLHDVDKLKHVYMQNRSWLDEAIARRLKNEKQQVIEDIKVINNVQKKTRLNRQKRSENTEKSHNINIVLPIEKTTHTQEVDVIDKSSVPEKKITYADSLRCYKDNETKQTTRRDNLEGHEIKRDYRKKKAKKSTEKPVEISFSEEEFKKDDRYMAPKHKQERKKYDRHSIQKKQKRKNKYEQWEIKKGYMKDFDDVSVTSSQENDFILTNPDKNVLSRDFERSSYIDQFSEANDNIKSTQTLDSITRKTTSKQGKKKDKRKDKDSNWYEKRALLRTEARKKLEHELFGETSPNTAGWYFRRMQKREQCRVRGDNSTHRKLSKRNMNFKLKN